MQIDEPRTPLASLDPLLNHWDKIGVRLRPGVTKEQLARAEVLLGTTLPEKMRQFFALCDGFDQSFDVSGAGRWAFNFWPIGDLEQVPEELGGGHDQQYFIFADYLLRSHLYAICLDGRKYGEIVLVGGRTWYRVSSSFGDFLSAYLKTPEQLLG